MFGVLRPEYGLVEVDRMGRYLRAELAREVAISRAVGGGGTVPIGGVVVVGEFDVDCKRHTRWRTDDSKLD